MAKMMKGVEPVKSTIISKSLFNLGAANNPPLELVARNAPRGVRANDCTDDRGRYNHVQGLKRRIGKGQTGNYQASPLNNLRKSRQ